VPILVAEFIAVLGFGAVLPILPLYIVEQGADPATLGLIVAAWPAARLVAEPFFGWLADRTSRRPLMIAGMLVMAVAVTLPLVFRGPIELILLRLLGGFGAGMYDPAARGYLVDATREGERGQVFGLYQAASMGGIVAGPGIAALGAQVWGGYAFPFVAGGLACLAAAAYLAVALVPRTLRPGEASGPGHAPIGETSFAELGTDSPVVAERSAAALEADTPIVAPLATLLNRSFAAAVAMNFGLYLAVGVYEVVWSLYMRGLGASISWIGVTFVLFGLPILLLAPLAGRIVDRLGALPFALVGGASVALIGFVYTLATEPVFPAVVGVVEASAHAFLGPAVYAILAAGSPPGRSSTAQGLFGASGTLAFIIGSLVAGRLLAVDLRYAFYFFAVASAASFALGWLILRGPRLTKAARSP
jgi:DHA1 family multidrug resistance protein-like MFS transporter